MEFGGCWFCWSCFDFALPVFVFVATFLGSSSSPELLPDNDEEFFLFSAVFVFFETLCSLVSFGGSIEGKEKVSTGCNNCAISSKL